MRVGIKTSNMYVTMINEKLAIPGNVIRLLAGMQQPFEKVSCRNDGYL